MQRARLFDAVWSTPLDHWELHVFARRQLSFLDWWPELYGRSYAERPHGLGRRSFSAPCPRPPKFLSPATRFRQRLPPTITLCPVGYHLDVGKLLTVLETIGFYT